MDKTIDFLENCDLNPKFEEKKTGARNPLAGIITIIYIPLLLFYLWYSIQPSYGSLPSCCVCATEFTPSNSWVYLANNPNCTSNPSCKNFVQTQLKSNCDAALQYMVTPNMNVNFSISIAQIGCVGVKPGDPCDEDCLQVSNKWISNLDFTFLDNVYQAKIRCPNQIGACDFKGVYSSQETAAHSICRYPELSGILTKLGAGLGLLNGTLITLRLMLRTFWNRIGSKSERNGDMLDYWKGVAIGVIFNYFGILYLSLCKGVSKRMRYGGQLAVGFLILFIKAPFVVYLIIIFSSFWTPMAILFILGWIGTGTVIRTTYNLVCLEIVSRNCVVISQGGSADNFNFENQITSNNQNNYENNNLSLDQNNIINQSFHQNDENFSIISDEINGFNSNSSKNNNVIGGNNNQSSLECNLIERDEESDEPFSYTPPERLKPVPNTAWNDFFFGLAFVVSIFYFKSYRRYTGLKAGFYCGISLTIICIIWGLLFGLDGWDYVTYDFPFPLKEQMQYKSSDPPTQAPSSTTVEPSSSFEVEKFFKLILGGSDSAGSDSNHDANQHTSSSNSWGSTSSEESFNPSNSQLLSISFFQAIYVTITWTLAMVMVFHFSLFVKYLPVRRKPLFRSLNFLKKKQGSKMDYRFGFMFSIVPVLFTTFFFVYFKFIPFMTNPLPSSPEQCQFPGWSLIIPLLGLIPGLFLYVFGISERFKAGSLTAIGFSLLLFGMSMSVLLFNYCIGPSQNRYYPLSWFVEMIGALIIIYSAIGVKRIYIDKKKEQPKFFEEERLLKSQIIYRNYNHDLDNNSSSSANNKNSNIDDM
eukprot:gene3603-4486_t